MAAILGLAEMSANYSIDYTAGFTYKYLPVPVIASAIYLLVIFFGKKWMADRTRYNLKTALVVWNLLLSVFSTVGFLVFLPPIIQDLRQNGYIYVVCHSRISTTPHLSFWAFLFVWSKIFEFGDTIFIVLRKTPLSFLHWYHHVTVLLYSWYGLATRNTGGHWFATINLGVHAVMYTYYMLKAMGFRIPSTVAKSITILQLTQFVIGLALVFTALWLRWKEIPCGINATHIRAGLIMYGSYFILFLNFFYRRYVKVLKKKKAE